VQRIVSLGAMLADLPHTRPPRVTGSSTNPHWHAQLEAWGIARRSRYEGPTGIASVMLDAARHRGMASLTLMGQAPHYLQRTTNPAMRQALLSVVARLLDLELDVSPLDAAVQAFRTRCDQAMAQNAATQAYVRQLEQAYDAMEDETPRPHRDDAFNPEQLIWIGKLNGIFAPVSVGAPPGAPPTWTPHHILVPLFSSSSLVKYFACILLTCAV